jgi:hypothetical protein
MEEKLLILFQKNQTYKGDKKFLFMGTSNGFKIYSYPDDDNENGINIDMSQVREVNNDVKFLGEFSTEYDYSDFIQINNKICGIYKTKNSFNNNFVA